MVDLQKTPPGTACNRERNGIVVLHDAKRGDWWWACYECGKYGHAGRLMNIFGAPTRWVGPGWGKDESAKAHAKKSGCGPIWIVHAPYVRRGEA